MNEPLKNASVKIIRRVEHNGAPGAITRRGRVIAQLHRPGVQPAGAAAKPWERLRAAGGRLLASPGESVLNDGDLEALS